MLVWNADLSLRVTSLSARLRGLAGIGSGAPGLHVSDLWGNDDRLAVALAAHHWALEGESLAFEAPIGGTPYHCEVEPLHDPSGSIVGVSGRSDGDAAYFNHGKARISGAKNPVAVS